MPTPKLGYRDKKGRKCPGVTTVIGQNLGWGQDALMGWAQWCGEKGFSWIQQRNYAGTIGTAAHDRIEAELKGVELGRRELPPDVRNKAEACFKGWVKWRGMQPLNFRVLELELHLVSEKYGFGGTVDAILGMDGQTVLTDWKTSSALRPSHLIQISAYWKLVEEMRPDLALSPQALLVNVNKSGQLKTHLVKEPELKAGFDAFHHLLELHRLRETLDHGFELVEEEVDL